MSDPHAGEDVSQVHLGIGGAASDALAYYLADLERLAATAMQRMQAGDEWAAACLLAVGRKGFDDLLGAVPARFTDDAEVLERCDTHLWNFVLDLAPTFGSALQACPPEVQAEAVRSLAVYLGNGEPAPDEPGPADQ
jgi:hypothetical protein